jgi:hypothetical protein
VQDAVAQSPSLRAAIIVVAIGAAVLIPSMLYLFALVQRAGPNDTGTHGDTSAHAPVHRSTGSRNASA